MTSIAAYLPDSIQKPLPVVNHGQDAATRSLRLAGGTTAYDDRGSGPLVLMIPSLGDIRQEYRFLAPLLVAAGHRVVTMDLRGHGESSAGWPDYSAAAVGKDVMALLGHLDAGPAVLVGTSLGAGAAVWAAAKAPAMVSGLVLIGPFVRDVPTSRLKAFFQGLLIRVAFAGPWAPAAWSAYYKSLYPGRPPADLTPYRKALAKNFREPGRMAAVKAMMLASKADIEAVHAEVHAPSMVVMGTRDPDFSSPAAEAEFIGSSLRAEVAMIDGAGHYPHAEMLEETAPHILRFLRQLGAA